MNRLLLCFSLALAFLPQAALGGCNEWTTNGPWGGGIRVLAGDPTNPEANWQPLPTTEIPLAIGTYPFFVINQVDGYPFGSEKAFTISPNTEI